MSRGARVPVAGPAGAARPATVGARLHAAVRRLRAAGIATARPDAERLLQRVLGTGRLALYLDPGRVLGDAEAAAFEALLRRRVRREPLQYLLGEEEFAGLRLAVGPGVFIPRPETELLVERAADAAPADARWAVDLCAGSGAVACALAVRRPTLRIWAVELEPAAAAWARRNVAALGLGDRVRVVEGDLFEPLPPELLGRVDLLVANPPYIARDALAALPAEVREWEPPRALDGGADGLAVIRRILAEAPRIMRPGGRLLLEIGHDQAERLRAALGADPRYGVPRFTRDLLGYERVLEAEVR